MDNNGMINKDLFHRRRQCEIDLVFLQQERPPEWVWTVWRQMLHKVCIICNIAHDTFAYLPVEVKVIPTVPSIKLPDSIDPTLALQDIVCKLPLLFQKLLGDVTYPIDDGQALAQAIAERSVTMYTDGTVDKGCGAHAYTIRTDNDDDNEAICGAAPTWGDPETISSLCTEHFGVLAGLLWTWLVMKKYEIAQGSIEGAVDNATVVNRINDGVDHDQGLKSSIASDRDVWDETMVLLSRMPVTCNLQHVKGHQDDMHKQGYHGPLPRDAFWNVRMDRKAEEARLMLPTPSALIFGSLSAEFIHNDQPIHTKISKKIKQEYLDPPLRAYIQQKEEWTDTVFDSVDWRAFEVAMTKLTIHKRINVAKYIFNWQNTGRQKHQLFEESQACVENRQPTCVGICPMECGEYEAPQHFFQCKVLNDVTVIQQRDFNGI